MANCWRGGSVTRESLNIDPENERTLKLIIIFYYFTYLWLTRRNNSFVVRVVRNGFGNSSGRGEIKKKSRSLMVYTINMNAIRTWIMAPIFCWCSNDDEAQLWCDFQAGIKMLLIKVGRLPDEVISLANPSSDVGCSRMRSWWKKGWTNSLPAQIERESCNNVARRSSNFHVSREYLWLKHLLIFDKHEI